MNNPPAFPQFGCSEHNDSGMTLRDYFAAAAMQGMIANPQSLNRTSDALLFHESNAKTAFNVADAMLKAREQ